MYHHFLTQQQIQEFLPVAQYDAAISALSRAGLSIISSSLDSAIVAEGTASQVSQALGLKYAVYSNGSSSYYTASGADPISGSYLISSNFSSILLRQPTDLVTGHMVPALGTTSQSGNNQTAPIEAYPITDLQSVYNATGLYAAGDNGKGYTAGILDFYGDPYIAQQLQYFDQQYNLPASPFTVTAIGPYNPGLGTLEGGSLEISLDVESVHAMAPGAAIDLYIANAALPFSAIIAAIVQQDKVNDLSQSFGFSEYQFSEAGATTLEMTVILTDQYYMLGSAEGITFVASTGDTGGSGFSASPEGTPAYPSTSPYVTAVGGTTTYLTYDGSKVSSFYQTAWSNYGFVPDQVNYGGGTGGISILEPEPWYQSGLKSPSTFASGREVPDISLNADVFPGILVVVPGNQTEISGGTSESDQLLGGLLTLLMGASKSSLGLLNPTLYTLGQSSTLNPKVYDPITFGYTIPWVASQGYNLATGWGAPNVGEMAGYIKASGPASLGVNVSASVNGIEQSNIFSGQHVTVSAVVTMGSAAISSGTFSAQLDTLAGAVAATELSYDSSSHSWTGTFTVPAGAAGISYLTVNGSSGGTSGSGFLELFSGYVATIISPTADTPYSSEYGIVIEANVTTLSGVPASGTFSFSAFTYSIQSNNYTSVATASTTYSATDYGLLWSGLMFGTYPNGPMLLTGDGDVYAYLPFVNGVGLQGSYIETTVLAEPGAVSPGQSVFVLASLIPPVNIPYVLSQETGLPVYYNIEEASNVTVSLVSQTGAVEASSQLYLNSFVTTSQDISGSLTVPSGLQPGLYNVILRSSYNSTDLGTTVNGSYFGQVYVAKAATTISTSITPSTTYEGQTVAVNAKIQYSNGTSVKYGMYQATVYPTGLQNDYTIFTEYASVPLWYDSVTGLWTGNVTLPSAYNTGGTVQVDQGALYLDGPYDVFISGVSADGVPSNTDISTQQGFAVQPYLYLEGATVTSFAQTSQVAFVGDTIIGPTSYLSSGPATSLTDDIFVGSNTIQGSIVTISQSQIQGTLTINDADVTLIGVTGGTVVAQNSKVILEQSSITSLQLTNSQVSLNASLVDQVSPSLPTISIQAPAAQGVYSGTTGNVTVTGEEVSSVAVYLDGVLLTTFSGASAYSFPLDSASMSVGVHTLEVVATQQDGLSSSSSVSFSTDGPLVAANNSISSLTTQVSSESNKVNALSSQLNSADDITYGLALLAVIALVVAIVALTRKPSSQPPASASPPPAHAPPAQPEQGSVQEGPAAAPVSS